MAGMQYFWIGVGTVYFASPMFFPIAGWKPASSNFWIGMTRTGPSWKTSILVILMVMSVDGSFEETVQTYAEKSMP